MVARCRMIKEDVAHRLETEIWEIREEVALRREAIFLSLGDQLFRRGGG
jgi:hypothetical protein